MKTKKLLSLVICMFLIIAMLITSIPFASARETDVAETGNPDYRGYQLYNGNFEGYSPEISGEQTAQVGSLDNNCTTWGMGMVTADVKIDVPITKDSSDPYADVYKNGKLVRRSLTRDYMPCWRSTDYPSYLSSSYMDGVYNIFTEGYCDRSPEGKFALEITDHGVIYQDINTPGDNSYHCQLKFSSGENVNKKLAIIVGQRQEESRTTGLTSQFNMMSQWVKENESKLRFVHYKDVFPNDQLVDGATNFLLTYVYSKEFSSKTQSGFYSDDDKYFSAVQDASFSQKWVFIIAESNSSEWTQLDGRIYIDPSIDVTSLVFAAYDCEEGADYGYLIDDAVFTPILSSETSKFPGVTAFEYKEPRSILNGGFGQPDYRVFHGPQYKGRTYMQLSSKYVGYWNTTSTDGKIELFAKDPRGLYYCNGSSFTPSRGYFGAELNGNETSTLYQYIQTSPKSTYTWSLNHRGRTGVDTMALIIGAKQSVDPKKTTKSGSDQFMSMADWAKTQSAVAEKIKELQNKAKTEKSPTPYKITVYSRKFGNNGTFVKETADSDADFSFTPTSKHTEKWEIWFISSNSSSDDTWSQYGDTSYNNYSMYDVPEGQTESIFAFVSIDSAKIKSDGTKDLTFGNLLDDINFELYHPAEAMSDTGGEGTLTYTQASKSKTVFISQNGTQDAIIDDNSTITIVAKPYYSKTTDGEYRVDGEGNHIQNTFLGAYITQTNAQGITTKKFYSYNPMSTKNDFSKTRGVVRMSYDTEEYEEGDIFTYTSGKLQGEISVELVYAEVYTATFLSNGGDFYESLNKGQTEGTLTREANSNVIRYTETMSGSYTADDCTWVNNSSKIFIGWQLLGTDYIFDGDVKISYAPYEGITPEEARLLDYEITDSNHKVEDDTAVYSNAYNGIVLVAQWKTIETINIKTRYSTNTEYYDDKTGGTVSLISSQTAEEVPSQYDYQYSYYGDSHEEITLKATPNTNYKFVGWFDKNDALITSSAEFTHQIPENPTAIYAKFEINDWRVKFHINNENIVSAKGDVDADLIRVYIPTYMDIDIVKSEYDTTKVTVKYLTYQGSRYYITEPFYEINNTTDQKGANDYIFNGWYQDKLNTNSNRPLKWNTDVYSATSNDNNLYAHWQEVGTVNKDSEDSKISSGSASKSNQYAGFDLVGTQIRYEEKDPNYPNGRGTGEGQAQHFDTDGLRYVACIKESILSTTKGLYDTIKNNTKFASYLQKFPVEDKPVQYGFVIAKETSAKNNIGDLNKLEYYGTNVNGVDVTKIYKKAFCQNVDCTSSVGGYNKDTVILDHRNYGEYRLYSLSMSYYNASKTDDQITLEKSKKIIARPYIRYQDANGLVRYFYHDYTGQAVVYGGCSTDYNSVYDYLKGKNYFPETAEN